MIVKSNKLYIDYLDYNMNENANIVNYECRLRFDLLLSSEKILCISVPACVKLESTTNLLMYLTPFWKSGKLKLILDNKHQYNPINYFSNRKHVLAKEFDEQVLMSHFEYIAYTSSRTDYFYNVFIKEIINISRYDLYIDKIFDTDVIFRKSLMTQINNNAEIICRNIPVVSGLHMGKIFNDLYCISNDRKSLFQRSAIIKKIINEYGATPDEVLIIRRMLDKGFIYANGISSYAAPLSIITNRLTGENFISIIKSVDIELFNIINNLNWNALYKLSINDTWLDFIDHLNRLLILYQESKKRKETLFSSFQIECSLTTRKLLKKLYDSAIESLQIELLKIGVYIIDVINIKNYSDKLIDYYIYSKNEYWDIIKQIDEFIPALKIVIRSLSRRYKDSSIFLRDQGYIISLNDNMF